MPIQVDHNARRGQLAAVVAKLIATRGLEAVTVRAVAEAAGFSTRVVSHYFTGKRDLLLFCYRHTAVRAETRLLSALESGRGDMAAAVNALLPYNEEACENWRVWVSFWGVAIADSEFSDVQRRQFSQSRQLIQDLLREELDVRSARSLNPEEASRHILSSLIGISVQAAFNPDDWPRARQQRLMAKAIESMGLRWKSNSGRGAV